MRSAIKAVGMLCSFLVVVVPAALGQDLEQKEPSLAATGPAYAATGPAFDVSVGYSFLTMPVPGAGRVNLNGLDVSAGVDLKPHWGAALDSNFARASNVLNVPHQAYALSFHAGPVFYPVEHGNTRMFVHVLAGIGQVDGAVPKSDDGHPVDYRHGWVVGPSYVLGGGVEHSLSGPIALRMSADYVRTSFFDHADAVLPQNDLRVTVSFVFPNRRARE